MGNQDYRIVPDPVYGYKRLDPIPEAKAIAQFYQSRYFELIAKGGKAPDIRRLMAGGNPAELERSWLRSTLYADILAVLEEQCQSNSRRLLDIGCGSGEFMGHWFCRIPGLP